MEEKREKLLYAVKTAVSEYGMEYVSTRNIAAAAGVSDSNIYRFYKDRDIMLHDAFILEVQPLHNWMVQTISLPDEAWGEKTAKECCRELFDGYWHRLMGEPVRTAFIVMYVHSKLFIKNSKKEYDAMIQEAAEQAVHIFPDRQVAVSTFQTIEYMIFGAAWKVFNGNLENNEINRNFLFENLFSILCKSCVPEWQYS